MTERSASRFAREESNRLVSARCEGRWRDVVPGFYGRHYTDCHLRLTGALLQYIGKVDNRPDPQAYS